MQKKKGFSNLVHLSILVIASVVIMVIAGCCSLKREDVLSDSGKSKKGDSLEVKVMSFNIASDVDDDDDDLKEWEERKGLIADIIRRQRPDVVGLQEAILLNTTAQLTLKKRFYGGKIKD